MGQPLYCSAVDAGSVGRDAILIAPPTKGDSAVSPCFHGCPAFLYKHFPPQSPPLHPLDLSLCSQCSPHPGIAPQSLNSTSCTFPGTCVPVWGMYGCCKVWFSFHLGCHRSAVTRSALNVSPLIQTIALMWGSDPCFSSPTHRGQVQPY